MDELHIRSVALLDPQSQRLLALASSGNHSADADYKRSLWKRAASIPPGPALQFTPVEQTSDETNVIHALGNSGADLVIASIGTDYFTGLGKQISFGAKGHAVIVDQAGNVLSHPVRIWVDEAKNIADVPPVLRMIKGETGVEQFYSSALKGDMIAGLTSVSGPGWGVMIPQPVAELGTSRAGILDSRTFICRVVGRCPAGRWLHLFLVKMARASA